MVLHNGSPRSELDVLEEKLVDTNKKLELMEKNAPELMSIKVGPQKVRIFSLLANAQS